MDRTRVLTIMMWVGLAVYVATTAASVGIIVVETQEAKSRIVTQQIASCRRVNELRKDANATVNALDRFLGIATEARIASGAPSDLKAAAEYMALQETLHLTPLTDCEKAFSD